MTADQFAAFLTDYLTLIRWLGVILAVGCIALVGVGMLAFGTLGDDMPGPEGRDGR